jgi:flagellar biogenesis protein FliO
MGYITNFIVYTLAMVGVIVVALLVFKNATSVGGGKSSKYLKVIDSISLGQRKNLYIVSTGKEQFLIAGDVNNTCLISKLEGLGDIKQQENIGIKQTKTPFSEVLNNLPKSNYMDKSNIGIKSSALTEKTGSSVMKNLAEILKQ